ncbi:MAG TPA: SCO1664 family protein [Acidimicrobiales bacterium]
MTLLAEGEIEIVGRMPWSSNQTFLVTCTSGDEELGAVYKPERGERHLWDFPGSIFRREVAAYELSVALGWELVPETISRLDAPFGEGSLQRFVDADFSQHHFTLIEDEIHHDQLRAICAFDVVANNADRKSGHCILGDDGKIWAIDNGLCFHREPKLRTVIWEFAGDPVPDELLADLSALADDVPDALAECLSPSEIDAVRRRARQLVKKARFPVPDPNEHCYPWPLV